MLSFLLKFVWEKFSQKTSSYCHFIFKDFGLFKQEILFWFFSFFRNCYIKQSGLRFLALLVFHNSICLYKMTKTALQRNSSNPHNALSPFQRFFFQTFYQESWFKILKFNCFEWDFLYAYHPVNWFWSYIVQYIK